MLFTPFSAGTIADEHEFAFWAEAALECCDISNVGVTIGIHYATIDFRPCPPRYRGMGPLKVVIPPGPLEAKAGSLFRKPILGYRSGPFILCHEDDLRTVIG